MKKNIKDVLKPGCHIHLMGICGTAMASLAGLLKERGYKVTGSDSHPYPPMSTQLENLGIAIQKPYAAVNLNPRPDFVIVGNVISANNEEAQELLKLGIPYSSLPQALGDLMLSERQSIVVSGTHGKTTTTSLMAWIAENQLKAQQAKPGFLIGGIPKNFSKSFQNPESDFFIIEGDEYDTAFFDKVPKFTHYHPKHVILTSIEFDHADIYQDLNAVKSAFQTLINLIPQEGTLIWSAKDQNISSLVTQSLGSSLKAQKVFSYGIGMGDFKAQVLESKESGSKFSVNFQGKDLGTFQTQMIGEYNILNALAAVALSYTLNWDAKKYSESLASFQGVKRRQEILGEPDGVLIIEDFAHHPTAVKETIGALQQKYNPRKVFSVFEPRSATSRRKVFQKEYEEAFAQAHEVYIAKAFDQSKLNPEDRFSSEELVENLKQQKQVQAFCKENVDEIIQSLTSRTQPGDVILIMSNGGFDDIYNKLIASLNRRKAFELT